MKRGTVKGQISQSIRVLQEWIDEFLVWKPEDYGGLDKIVVEPKRMWVPSLATGNRSVYDIVVNVQYVHTHCKIH